MKKPPSHDTTTSFLDEIQTVAAKSNSKKASSVKETQYTVVKRNGTLVPFRRDRILHAIEAAFRDTKKIEASSPIDAELKKTIEQMTDLVMKQVLALATKGACLTVEGIQDVVEVTLMKNGHHDVARDYIIYRDERKAKRETSLQNLKIYRRDKTTPARFNPMKIASSIERAFRRARKIEEQSPDEVVAAVNLLTQKIVSEMAELSVKGDTLYIDMIEDRLERELMNDKFFDVAKSFILYRAEKALRQANLQPLPSSIDENAPVRTFEIATSDSGTVKINELMIRNKLAFACRGFEALVSVDELLETSISQFYTGMKEHEVDLANVFAAKSKIEKEPAYSQVASRLLLDVLYRETMGLPASDSTLNKAHRQYFKKYVKGAIAIDRLSPDLLDFDLDELGSAMDLKRDDLFNYLGLQTLYDRYFIHQEQRRLETPQIFWMRVAMGLSLGEGEQKNKRAVEFYNVLSQFYFTSSTPTLFNSGTRHSQLSSCYLSTVMDDLQHIFKVVADDAQLSKWAGGIGNDWTNVRATGARIKGTNGTSQGVIPFLKVANDTAVAVNQCFAPETEIFTNKGILPISEIKVGDLVLGVSGTYRQVEEKFTYNQKDPMVSLSIKHAIEPVSVTAGHPFYAIRGVPMEQANERTLAWLTKGKVKCEWVEAAQLQKGDYVAQTIPKEVVSIPNFTEEDARLYGILLGDGHMTQDEHEWGVSGNPQSDEHLEFVHKYLGERGIHFWETGRGSTYMQIHWASGQGAVRDATTGRITGAGAPTLPFERSDLYDANGNKHIAPAFAHLPRPQALALLQGLLETDGNISRGKEMTFANTSRSLIQGVRYQCLRFGIPTAGNFRVRENDHEATRSDGSVASFKGTTKSYDLRIPAFPELAAKMGCPAVVKQNWLQVGGQVFSRVKSVAKIDPVPFVNDLVVEGDESYMTTSGLAHNGGKRKGAMCAYLETWHLDIEDFLELRKNTGDERRRTHDMNTANWIPDLFMKRVREGGMWTLFSPSDVPDLHDLYGAAFEKRYIHYEKMVEEGKLKLHKKIEALNLWRKMLSMLFETGHPWITFKDPSNIRSPQDHVGVVHSSNLCTEILLNSSAEETAVCNLGSVNLAMHVTEKGLDEKQIAATVRAAVRMLDNVIDINFYPTVEAKTSNQRHRPIGLGFMGFQDALYIQNISFASHAAVEFSDKSMEMISYYAIMASSELAQERGTYPTYKGSKWDRGMLPIDTLDVLEKERGLKVDVDRSSTMKWDTVRAAVKKHGMRNSNTMAIAPTATIANITGVVPSNEPIYKHLFVKSNLSGEFTVTNPHLVAKLKENKLWDDEMVDDLKYFDGSIREIDRIPAEIKALFLTAFEVEPEWVIECGARRQKWLDMGQSLNLYLAEPSGKKLHQMYLMAWEKGLKTTYYLRSLGATQIEKSTMDINKRGLQPRWMKNKSASSNIKIDREEEAAPKACPIDGSCESCQ
jgi:ribonucleoside-diphosphate reductase alpha chain